MPRHWVITPYSATEPEVFDHAWAFDLSNGTIAIGWSDLGDTSGLSHMQLTERCREVWDDRYSPRDRNTIWRFYHEMEEGDHVIARRGTKKAIAFGTVAGPPFYDEAMGRKRVGEEAEHSYANFIPVEWQPLEIEFPKAEFSFYTLYEIPADRYEGLIEVCDEDGIKPSPEFVLEKYLEDFIVSNFDSVFGGQLVLHSDQDGSTGQQYSLIDDESTEIGRVDILAREPSTDSYVVIELKKGRGSDEVVGQVLRYMGWVKEHLCRGNQGVKGLIICKEKDRRLDYALSMVQGHISVKYYSVSFQLSD